MKVFEKARTEASNLRRAIGAPTGPLDLDRLADTLEAQVHYRPLGEISGMIDKQSGDQAQIVINSRHSEQRQRFTLAHEIGHLVERIDNGDDNYSFVEYRGRAYDLHEFFADEFAGAILMPEEELNELRAKGYSAAALAAHFHVSAPAVEKRLTRLARQPTPA